MKPILHVLLSALGLVAGGTTSVLAQGTAFTYQGRLNDGTNPANGLYDLTFTLFDTNQPGGNVIAGPLTNSATAVSNGLFTLTLDFGNPFDGTGRWLEIGVQTNGGNGFTALAPRQLLTPTPYAIRAADAALAEAVPPDAITGTMLASGAVASVNLAPGAVWRLDTPDASLLGALQVGRDGLIGIGTNDSGAATPGRRRQPLPQPRQPRVRGRGGQQRGWNHQPERSDKDLRRRHTRLCFIL